MLCASHWLWVEHIHPTHLHASAATPSGASATAAGHPSHPPHQSASAVVSSSPPLPPAAAFATPCTRRVAAACAVAAPVCGCGGCTTHASVIQVCPKQELSQELR
jgi:hypothetical protein